jgi:hypothetical protein
MRRVTGFGLTLLGTFLIVVAALLRFWLGPDVAAEYPLGWDQTISLTGTGSYFSQALVQEQSNVSVGVTYTLLGNTGLGSGNTAVWDSFTSVQDLTNKQPITYLSYREAFNRRTGQLVDCCGEYVTNPVSGKQNHSVHMSGQAVVFPMGTHGQTYSVFDTIAAKQESATYQGAASVEGILTYKFVENVAPTKIGTEDVPGSILSEPSVSEVPLGEYYSATNTFYVDPVTGDPLDILENQTITLGSSPSNVEINASQLSVVETASSVATSVSKDQGNRQGLQLVEDVLPLIGLLAGLVLLVIGIILLWLSGDRDEPDSRLMHELDTYA